MNIANYLIGILVCALWAPGLGQEHDLKGIRDFTFALVRIPVWVGYRRGGVMTDLKP